MTVTVAEKLRKFYQNESRAHPGKVFGVPQKDGPLLSDAVAMVKLHQLVQGGEELVPHVVLTTAILQHLEVLDMVPVTVKRNHKNESLKTSDMD